MQATAEKLLETANLPKEHSGMCATSLLTETNLMWYAEKTTPKVVSTSRWMEACYYM
jgi:hypothetical protein